MKTPQPPYTDRRQALIRGLSTIAVLSAGGGLLSACASSARRSDLPEVRWPRDPLARPTPPLSAPSVRPYERKWSPLSEPEQVYQLQSGVIPRNAWARATPEPRLMNRMLPVSRITLHHDGMTSFTSANQSDAAQRLEMIRAAHRSNGWGDIGYHFVIDPAGRIWEGRPLFWQGAHVKNQNEGNLGICLLGNYEVQRPNSQQLAAVDRFVAEAMRQYRIPVSRVHTHKELGSTLCPGRNLQPLLVASRSPGGTLYRVA